MLFLLDVCLISRTSKCISYKTSQRGNQKYRRRHFTQLHSLWRRVHPQRHSRQQQNKLNAQMINMEDRSYCCRVTGDVICHQHSVMATTWRRLLPTQSHGYVTLTSYWHTFLRDNTKTAWIIRHNKIHSVLLFGLSFSLWQYCMCTLTTYSTLVVVYTA